MADQTDQTLAEILSMVLERPVGPGEALARTDEPKWDSLKHLEIVFAVEAAFGVSFSAEEIADLKDVAALRAKVAHAP